MDASQTDIKLISDKISTVYLPDELKERVLARLGQLEKLVNSASFLPEFDRMNRYVDWLCDIPWKTRTQDMLDLTSAKQLLDKHHYGLGKIKDRILEYMAVMKLNTEQNPDNVKVIRAPILCFVGLVGTGKTTFAKSIAEAMGRKFARIPFGGMGSPFDLRGQSRMHPEAEPGKIIKALTSTGSINPVILLDEIDRVTEEGRASIMGVLVELLDPEQNSQFVDHYVDFPVNLSEVLFVATANNTRNISTAVLDRIEPLNMPSYTDQEKITIARDYMLPRILQESGIPAGSIVIQDDVWANITRPLGFDAGMRTLERTIEGIVRKIARMMVEGRGQSFTLTPENIREYLPE